MALSEAMFTEKIDKLNSTQQSIENTSSWCSLWRSDARSIVTWWETYFSKANQAKRLCMIYLANDVLQTSRKKGPEFVVEFYKVLPRALRHFLSKADEKSKTSVNKVIKVWEERRVFGSSKTKTLQELIEEAEPTGGGSIPGGSVSRPYQSNKRPRSGTRAEAGGGTGTVPASLMAAAECVAAAEAAAANSAELAGRAASIQIPEDAHLSPEAAAANRQTLVEYQTALQVEVVQREIAKTSLLSAAEAQTAASLQLADSLKICEAKLEALDKLQASAPPALSQPVAALGGVEATVDAAEAADLAAQLMQNPQALLDAIAATMPQAGSQGQGQEGGGGVQAAAAGGDEYDPEDFF